MRARKKITHRAQVLSGGKDRLGNSVVSWAEPVTIRVFGWGPQTLSQNDIEGLSVTNLIVGSPSHYGIKPKDQLIIMGNTYEVEGPVIDSNQGPFGYEPGYVIVAKRVVNS